MSEKFSAAYQFSCPPDYNWLPSSYLLFDGNDVETEAPSQLEIQLQCEALSELWTEPERILRRLSAEQARESGVCRNS